MNKIGIFYRYNKYQPISGSIFYALEYYFTLLNIIEKENINNTDKYKVLNSISYYISIVESVEKGDEND